jgi:predicted acyl esterase
LSGEFRLAGHDNAMDRRDRDAGDPDWDDDWDEPRRPRRSLFGRGIGLVKLAVFALPVAMLLYGSFADCSARPAAAGWLGLVGAGACARSEMIGNVLSMQDNFALLKRLID